MTEQRIPDYALQPAREADDAEEQAASGIFEDRSAEIGRAEDESGFDPTPYDRLLAIRPEAPVAEPEPDADMAETGAFEDETTDSAKTETETAGIETKAGSEAEVGFESNAKTGAETDSRSESESNAETGAEVYAEIGTGSEFKAEPAAEWATEPTAEPEAEEAARQSQQAQEKPLQPTKITPLESKAVYDELSVTTISEKGETRVFIEEDVLVPDTKPDLASILSMDGKAILSEREVQVGQSGEENLRIVGEISLQTIYLPEGLTGNIATIQSRLPFKNDWTVNSSPLSHIVITPVVESLTFTVVNERKFRAKATVKLELREYAKKEVPCFERLEGENLELLKEKLEVTTVALRKKNPVEIDEELVIKEGSPLPEKILKYDIDVVENHKQVAGEKIVINAGLMCSVLYLGKLPKVTDTYGEAEKTEPALLRAKTEFTQFIPIEKIDRVAGSKVSFDSTDLKITLTETEGDVSRVRLKGSIETHVEVYQNLEKEMVSDLYDSVKTVTYEYDEDSAAVIKGRVTTEASVREIINVPAEQGAVEKIVYLGGKIKESRSTLEQSRNIVEGKMDVELLCIPAGESAVPFALNETVAFRGAMDIPKIKGTPKADNEIYIKDLWFDKINGKQIEVNAGLLINSTIMEEKPYKMIKNLCYSEPVGSAESRPAIVVHIAKKGDDLWKIAKKYGTTMESVRELNDLKSEKIEKGHKLLIVR